MDMIACIEKKKQGFPLSKEEIFAIIKSYTEGDLPEYQMSAFLMAVWFRGMNHDEIYHLTMAMMHSGETMDLSSLGLTIDKHSTGRIGDKLTLIVAPLWAASGLTVAKMSGRGLGFTGGTIDKMESVTGCDVALTPETFLALAKENRIVVTGQSKNLVPADKKIYALRDVTATVDSIPLIASSIMSKKLATSADVLILDVKFGRGSFMETKKDAKILAQTMIEIGEKYGRKVAALLSPMEFPLGFAVGNALEVKEAYDILGGNGSADLMKHSLFLTILGLYASGLCANVDDALNVAKRHIADGSGQKKLCEMFRCQGGQFTGNDLCSALDLPHNGVELIAEQDGYITDLNALTVGTVAMNLGAGRKTLNDTIDHSAGILLKKNVGDYVCRGEVLASLYGKHIADDCQEQLEGAFTFGTKDEIPADGSGTVLFDSKELELKGIIHKLLTDS